MTLVNAHPGKYTTIIPGDFTTDKNPGTDVSAGNTAAFANGWTLSGSGEPPTARSARRSRTRSSTPRVSASARRR